MKGLYVELNRWDWLVSLLSSTKGDMPVFYKLEIGRNTTFVHELFPLFGHCLRKDSHICDQSTSL